MDLVNHIEALFARHGSLQLGGPEWEVVGMLQHALQCAQLAEWAQADKPLIAAALLHDLGHIVDDAAASGAAPDDVHELRALPLLRRGFGADVTEPVRLHVQAKRYLVAVDPRYTQHLPQTSQRSLLLQGGPMDDEEVAAFEDHPFAVQAVALRRWDDVARAPVRRTPPLAYYVPLLRDLCSPGAVPLEPIRIGAEDI